MSFLQKVSKLQKPEIFHTTMYTDHGNEKSTHFGKLSQQQYLFEGGYIHSMFDHLASSQYVHLAAWNPRGGGYFLVIG